MPPRILELVAFASVAVIALVIRIQYPDEFVAMIPMLGTFAFAVLKLLPRLSGAGSLVMQVMNFLPNLEVVHQLLDDRAYTRIENGDRQFQEFESSIAFQDVGFGHKSRGATLSNVSLVIDKNRMTAIVGPSGSGKSTLVDLLLRLYDVDSGRICIDGEDIREYDMASVLAKVGFVGQETFIYNASVRDNIAFGHEYDLSEIEAAARLADADGFIERLPEGYDTLVGDRGVKLSGGERQRIAIARAMIRKPEILILDEATSSLDNISEEVVQKAIDKVSAECTTLVIAHRLSTIRDADVIYVLDEGRIVESGTHDELIELSGKYWELYSA
jgi:ABC-type multidrug transport system fused ATPase/permease subunit